MDDATPVGVPVKPLSRRLRFEILRRDGYRCHYCGVQASQESLAVDHVIPRALGGTDEPSNLVTACQPCNSGKGSTSPDERVVDAVDAAALKFAKAMERAAEIRSKQLAAEGDVLGEFEAIWNSWTYTDRAGARHTLPMAKDWRTSIQRFLNAGFTLDDMRFYVRTAMESTARHDDKFRYLCGCLWRETSNRQELARQLIEAGEV